MTDQFSENYAEYYDLLYAEKDYRGEADYVAQILRNAAPFCRTVLEFGSGTGRHASLMAANGFEVVGVEKSSFMLKRSQASVTSPFASFYEGDMRTFDAGRIFDAVVSLFHVVSYLRLNEDVIDTFGNARRHLKPGGLFMFDFWYGPAVLSAKPECTIKEIESAEMELIRFSRTDLDVNTNSAIVHYAIVIQRKAEATSYRLNEVHALRYFFVPELEFMLKSSGFRLVLAEEWMTRKPLDGSTWSGTIVAEAID